MTETQIEVSQRAREEAADLWIKVDGDFVTPAILQEAERYRRGDYDHTPAVQAFARFERDILATRTDATPVAWTYVNEHWPLGSLGQPKYKPDDQVQDGWTEVPLYTHPPATDVAALVEAAKAVLPSNMAHIPEWMDGKDVIPLDVYADELRALIAALAPFTKGQP